MLTIVATKGVSVRGALPVLDSATTKCNLRATKLSFDLCSLHFLLSMVLFLTVVGECTFLHAHAHAARKRYVLGALRPTLRLVPLELSDVKYFVFCFTAALPPRVGRWHLWART